jgi:hypothetical protein
MVPLSFLVEDTAVDEVSVTLNDPVSFSDEFEAIDLASVIDIRESSDAARVMSFPIADVSMAERIPESLPVPVEIVSGCSLLEMVPTSLPDTVIAEPTVPSVPLTVPLSDPTIIIADPVASVADRMPESVVSSEANVMMDGFSNAVTNPTSPTSLNASMTDWSEQNTLDESDASITQAMSDVSPAANVPESIDSTPTGPVVWISVVSVAANDPVSLELIKNAWATADVSAPLTVPASFPVTSITPDGTFTFDSVALIVPESLVEAERSD